ncbi:MAG: ThiF family adenylyltransferase [Candidatus Bipolaricaulota bacterium]
MNRYQRQITLPQIGERGQEILGKASVLVVGCGALGTHTANALVRAGLGKVTVVDRDYLERTNLHRLASLDEEDLHKPKALALKEKLTAVNSDVCLKTEVADVNPQNIEGFVEGKDLVLDCTDNLLTRYLINDACVKGDTPWIYAAVVGTTGMTMSIAPGRGPCFQCLFSERPSPGSLPTCETAGVVNTIPQAISALQVTAAYRLLQGELGASGTLSIYDIWENELQQVQVEQNDNCSCCVEENFQFLEAESGETSTTLCGREAIQVNPMDKNQVDLAHLAQRLSRSGEVTEGKGLVRVKLEDYLLTVFEDGRAIIEGTEDETEARSLYSRYIGN